MANVHPLPFNCPHCGQPLHYTARVTHHDIAEGATEGDRDWHLYHCRQHGPFHVSRNTPLQPA